MAFHTEPPHYMKTVLSDLQGAWENLRDAVVHAHPFPESDRLLFHIDEGMSWESVRNLENMKKERFINTQFKRYINQVFINLSFFIIRTKSSNWTKT